MKRPCLFYDEGYQRCLGKLTTNAGEFYNKLDKIEVDKDIEITTKTRFENGSKDGNKTEEKTVQAAQPTEIQRGTLGDEIGNCDQITNTMSADIYPNSSYLKLRYLKHCDYDLRLFHKLDMRSQRRE